MIKASREEGLDVYYRVCTKIWETGQWPTDWVRAMFIPLPKKGGIYSCALTTEQYLYSVMQAKFCIKVIMKRMENKLEEEVSNTQAGFRKNRGQ